MNPKPDKRLPSSSAEWLLHAKSDLRYAQMGIQQSEILPHQVCFHAQQAAEKALKAVLLLSQIEFPLTHDIIELIDIYEIHGITLPEDFDDAAVLTPYAVETRYPGYFIEIFDSDVTQALMIAEKIVTWAEKFISEFNKKEIP